VSWPQPWLVAARTHWPKINRVSRAFGHVAIMPYGVDVDLHDF